MSTLYKEELLEHYKNPNNFGALEDADFELEKINPLCGDKQKWYIKFALNETGDKIVSSAGFTGDGCAISIAMASILSETIKGKTKEDILNITKDNMSDMIGAQVSPARTKCLLLSLHAVQEIVNQQ